MQVSSECQAIVQHLGSCIARAGGGCHRFHHLLPWHRTAIWQSCSSRRVSILSHLWPGRPLGEHHPVGQIAYLCTGKLPQRLINLSCLCAEDRSLDIDNYMQVRPVWGQRLKRLVPHAAYFEVCPACPQETRWLFTFAWVLKMVRVAELSAELCRIVKGFMTMLHLHDDRTLSAGPLQILALMKTCTDADQPSGTLPS